MLLSFSVQNFRSIEARQEISFVASSLKDYSEGLISSSALPQATILPVVILYGANASGKSNFIAAIRYMRTAILSSQNEWKPEGGTRLTQFELGPEGAKETTSAFEANFIFEGIRYQYGFEASPQQFLSEWLYWYPNQHQQKLFTRKGSEFDWGRSLKGSREVIRGLTRPNSLFLSAAAQNGHEALMKVRDAFDQIGGEMRPTVDAMSLNASLDDDELDARVVDYLEKIGTGISEIRRREQEFDDETKTTLKEFEALFKRVVPNSTPITDDKRSKASWVELGHKTKDGRVVYFRAERESAGTRRLLGFLGTVFLVLDQGGVMVIDEMSNSLHTKACELVLSLFCNPSTNPHGAQLIAATHDTNLLRSSLLRRDEVWFVEKNEYGASHIYPLTDIKTRKTDNIEEGYIQGRFGAVPFSGSASKLYDEKKTV